MSIHNANDGSPMSFGKKEHFKLLSRYSYVNMNDIEYRPNVVPYLKMDFTKSNQYLIEFPASYSGPTDIGIIIDTVQEGLDNDDFKELLIVIRNESDYRIDLQQTRVDPKSASILCYKSIKDQIFQKCNKMNPLPGYIIEPD